MANAKPLKLWTQFELRCAMSSMQDLAENYQHPSQILYFNQLLAVYRKRFLENYSPEMLLEAIKQQEELERKQDSPELENQNKEVNP